MLSKQQLAAAAAGAVIALGLGAGAVTFAQTASTSTSGTTTSAHMPGVGGTVTAVSGNTVTVTGKDGKTYTIDASSAAITKDETVNVSSIAVGDTVMAEGMVNGTSVTATNIHDGKMPAGGFGGGRGPAMMGGRGIHGTVSAINGSTLTIAATNPQSQAASSYTVDASSATVLKGDGTGKPLSSTLSSVAVGDTVMVMGATNGTTVTAKMIVDGPMPKMQWNGTKPPTAPQPTTTQ